MTDPGLTSEEVSDLNTRVAPLDISTTSLPTTSENKSAGEEQALESHEVIELQTFSDRKAWIEEKIKFLESLPPIDVFAGLDAVKSSSEEVPGLPTRLELQRWVIEHDAIEKETEFFDTGELTKLRQLTKAATQRNLSPEDTDVIELTLTTIYGLDKLLHLLRDRSESLEMMGIRLTWEENRQQSWKERRQIIEDLEAFCISRARWSPSIYDSITRPEESPGLSRRSSNASLVSAGSDSALNSQAFSRSTRFKLAELLSRDAAQFSGRVTGLRHGKVAAAGKALDKLIDHSRKPVPDELLDEQDRLEEKCINEMENISKFTMNLVMQWRKADEIYVETMKDLNAASNLLEEIETAKLYHPTARQSTSFMSRVDTILKRLAVRGDPSATTSMFPRPEHFLFPDQKPANEALIKFLSMDINKVNRLAKRVDIVAKDFRTAYEAVKHVETLTKSADDLSSTFAFLITKLEDGISTDEGDGSSLDLSVERCLDPTSHSVFLAFLPSLLDSTQSAMNEADHILRTAPAALVGLEIRGIDREFKENAVATVNGLASIRENTLKIRNSITGRLTRLRESRKISSYIDSKVTLVKALKSQIVESMHQERWQQESSNSGAPTTPESSTTSLFTADNGTTDFDKEFLRIGSKLNHDITNPLEVLSATLEPELLACLKEKESRLRRSLQRGNLMLRILHAIREQTSAMNSVRDEFHEIISRTEDCKAQIQDSIETTLEAPLDGIRSATEMKIVDLKPIEGEVASFINGLTHRVPFVAQHSVNRKALANPTSPLSTNFSDPDVFDDLSIDLVSLDAGVRADSNSYTMRLSGNLDTLKNAQTRLELVRKARLADLALESTNTDIVAVIQDLSSQKSLLSSIPRNTVEGIGHLQAMMDGLVLVRDRRSNVGRSLSQTRALLRAMDELSNKLDASTRESIFKSRENIVNDAELRIKSWDEDFTAFINSVSTALISAHIYQDELKAAEEGQKKAEAERLAAEEEEHLRLEREALEAAEQRHLLEEKLAEEQRMELERQREAIELAERERLAQEAAEAKRFALEQLEKQAEAARSQVVKDKLAKEEAERARLEQERIEMLDKIREAEVQLQKERRLHAERQTAALELEKERQVQMELQRKQQDMQRLAEDQARQAEVDKLVRQQKAELERLAEDQARKLEIERIERQQEAETRRINDEKAHQAELELERRRQVEKQQFEDNKAREIDLARAEATRLAEEQTRRSEIEELAKRQQIEEKRFAEEWAAQTQLRDLAESEALRVAAEQAHQAKLEDLTRQREAERQRLVDELTKSESARIVAEQALQVQLEQAAKQLQAKEQIIAEERAGKINSKELGETEMKKFSAEPVLQSQAEDLAKQQQAEAERVAEEVHCAEVGSLEKHRQTEIQSLEEANQTKHRLIKQEKNTENRIYQLASNEADVFGNQATPNPSNPTRSKKLTELQSQLVTLRKRLRSIGINEARRPSKSSSNLPTEVQYQKMHHDLSSISADTLGFPSMNDTSLNTELKLLKADVEEAFVSLKEVQKLSSVHGAVRACDAALSDLLEHIDSYPAAPMGILSSAHRSVLTVAPAEQLSSRLNFTRDMVDDMILKCEGAIDDHRTRSEHSRIQQTWTELEEMANDRISGNKSRPSSAISRNSSRAGRNSISSMPAPPLPTHPRAAKKKGSYSNLSVSSISIPSKGKMLAPPVPQSKTRRATSGTNEAAASPSTSRQSSISSNRSVSGPLNSSLYGSTYASRQRTTSLSSSVATPTPSISSRFRIVSETKTKRSHSPAMSEISTHSHSHSRSSLGPSRSSGNPSTWSRAPRDSFSSILPHPRAATPVKKPDSAVRKKYVADPKSKLDIAVGDVVNQLSVGINIEGITESWRDQSGKYWIGNQDPKLCFCRILRSQTVMVRVGGGWTELSKFIKDHFAESFRIAPDSPRIGAQEKWISSASLMESISMKPLSPPLSPPRAPHTPEPTLPFVPSFSLMTPSGQSPQSLKSSPSVRGGSPLAPLQYMRRAELEHSTSLLRPVTPSKTPLRGRTSNPNTSSRNSVWRP